jgi:hypothetical protein
MGSLAVLNHEGDTTISWAADRPEEVDAARRTWNALVRDKGYTAFEVDDEGQSGERIREFSPSIGRVLLIPPMQGG